MEKPPFSTSNRNMIAGLLPLVSSITPMLAAASQNSGFMAVEKFTNIVGAAYSDQSGTLLIEFSADGVNTDYSHSIAVTGADSTTTGFSQTVILPYVKFTYTNGAVNQTDFRFAAYGRLVS